MNYFGRAVIVLGAALLALGCTPNDSAIKRCAEAITELHVAAECTAMPSCVFTVADLRQTLEAGATKQNDCPVDNYPEASQ